MTTTRWSNRRSRRDLRARVACDGRVLEAAEQTGNPKNGWCIPAISRARTSGLYVHFDRKKEMIVSGLQTCSGEVEGRAVAARHVPWSLSASPMKMGEAVTANSCARQAPGERGRIIDLVSAQRLGACPKQRQVRHGMPDDRRRQRSTRGVKGGLWTGRERMVG